MKKILTVATFFFLIQGNSYSQTFGFGCLGFVGGFGGYSYLQYKADGLNDYISFFNSENKDSIITPMGKFKTAQGYIVGINFFRAKFPSMIITTKGFYESLSKKENAELSSTLGGSSYHDYDLKLNSWGVGVDLGTELFAGLSWKIIDASLLYNQAVFTKTENLPGAYTSTETYKSDFNLGYSLGTGFIFELVDEYVTLEGLAGYTSISVSSVHKDDGTELTVNDGSTEPINNFIVSGGFNAVVKLNVGLPL
jgi:hypothetical protein